MADLDRSVWLWKEWSWCSHNPCKSHEGLITSYCDYGRSRMSNITLCATYIIYRRFLGKFTRLDTADRMSWNFAGDEADFARRGTGPRTPRSKRPRTMRIHNLYVSVHASTLIPPNFRNICSRLPSEHIFPTLLDSGLAFTGSSTRRRGGKPRKERVSDLNNNSNGVWTLIM